MEVLQEDGQREAAAPAEAAPKQHLTLLFIAILLTMLMSALDQSIFGTALPTIVGELHGVDHMLWVTTAYLLAATITMPLYGKFGDLYGRKGLFLSAQGLFLLGSIIGGLGDSMAWLIGARAVQGLGGGGLMVLSQSIIADVIPPRERGKYMGIIGSVFGLSSVAGPLLGGWFTESIGWRWCFWINLPIAAVAIAVSWAFLRLPRRRSGGRPDVAGIIFSSVAVTALIFITSFGGHTYEWDSPVILTLIVVCGLAAAAFVAAESRAAQPIIPLYLFKERNFNIATISGMVLGIAMFGCIAYMPTYLQMVFGVNATASGILMLPMVAGMMTSSISSGALATKYGRYKWMPLAGLVILIGTQAIMQTLTVDTPLAVICGYLFLLGLGLGFAMQILVLVVQNSFPISEVGTATAANNFFREIGASIGASVVGSIFTARLTDLLDERMPGAIAQVAGKNPQASAALMQQFGAAGSGESFESSLTPGAVADLPGAIHDVIITSYNDALAPIFGYLLPLTVIALATVLFLREDPLRTSNETAAAVKSVQGSGE